MGWRFASVGILPLVYLTSCVLESNPAFQESSTSGASDEAASDPSVAEVDAGGNDTATSTPSTSTSTASASGSDRQTDTTNTSDTSQTGAGSTYADMILSDGPVGYWRLNESVGPTAVDASPSGFDGTYVGGVVLEQPGVLDDGEGDLAAYFDGVDDRIEVADVLGFAEQASFSAEAWVKADSLDGVIVGKLEYDRGYQGWFFGLFNGNVIFNRNPGVQMGATAPTLGEFHHLAVVYDGITMFIYIDGQQATAKAADFPIPAHTKSFMIGYGTSWGSFPGVVDEVAVYDYPLSSSRVAAHFAGG